MVVLQKIIALRRPQQGTQDLEGDLLRDDVLCRKVHALQKGGAEAGNVLVFLADGRHDHLVFLPLTDAKVHPAVLLLVKQFLLGLKLLGKPAALLPVLGNLYAGDSGLQFVKQHQIHLLLRDRIAQDMDGFPDMGKKAQE